MAQAALLTDLRDGPKKFCNGLLPVACGPIKATHLGRAYLNTPFAAIKPLLPIVYMRWHLQCQCVVDKIDEFNVSKFWEYLQSWHSLLLLC